MLKAALGTLLHIRIDYYAAVNLQGFANVVNRLGGVDVNVAHGFCDPTYDQYGYLNGFSITAGHHHLNGLQALAYARVRKASGLPVAVGFGIKTPERAAAIARVADAVVVGSALVDEVAVAVDMNEDVTARVLSKVEALAKAVRAARTGQTAV